MILDYDQRKYKILSCYTHSVLFTVITMRALHQQQSGGENHLGGVSGTFNILAIKLCDVGNVIS